MTPSGWGWEAETGIVDSWKKTLGKRVPMHMSANLKDDRLPKLQARYERREREGKTRRLDELCEDHGYERKYTTAATAGSTSSRRAIWSSGWPSDAGNIASAG